jgi:protein arginine N-methyltransferase 1
VISPLDEHLGYLADTRRLQQYETAIARAIRPGDVVLDLGCGTGILGLLCLKAGAAKVYAIDSTLMIGVAEQALQRAGYGDRAVFVQGKAHQVELPERVDVVICDQVGYFGFDYGIVESLRDAKRRFLKPGGRMIPARIDLKLGVIQSETCRALADGWQARNIPAEFHWLRENMVNSKHAVSLRKDDVLGVAELGTIDLHADNPDFHSWSAQLRVERDGVLHGIAGWFDCELADGVRMTNSPLSELAIQRHQAFLPIAEAVEVKTGDAIRASVMARPADSVIAWRVDIPRLGRSFGHSTWQGELLSPRLLARRDPQHVPTPSRTGLARACVLSYCDGNRSAHEIEQAVLRDHPDLLPSTDEIVRFVAHVLGGDTV